jgi:hypothetical protein
MGGEKWPILVYGSTERYDLQDWLHKFSLVDDKDEDDSESEFEQESNEDDFEKLSDFVSKNGFIMVYFGSWDWSEFGIGLEVPDVDDLTNEEKEKVNKFCKKFKLSKPKIFAGIIGEYE